MSRFWRNVSLSITHVILQDYKFKFCWSHANKSVICVLIKSCFSLSSLTTTVTSVQATGETVKEEQQMKKTRLAMRCTDTVKKKSARDMFMFKEFLEDAFWRTFIHHHHDISVGWHQSSLTYLETGRNLKVIQDCWLTKIHPFEVKQDY